METTISIEFTSDTKEHLKTLEHQLKHIHGVHIDLVEPRDHSAPALIAVAIDRHNKRERQVAHDVAAVLHDFLHIDSDDSSSKKVYLVTIEGERTDIEPLSIAEIERIIDTALEGETI